MNREKKQIYNTKEERRLMIIDRKISRKRE